MSQNNEHQSGVIKTMDQLVLFIGLWHKSGINQAKHMLEMPEGFEAEYTDEKTGETVKLNLSGDMLRAFRMGVLTGIDAFQELPIAYVDEPKEASNEPTSPDTPE